MTHSDTDSDPENDGSAISAEVARAHERKQQREAKARRRARAREQQEDSSRLVAFVHIPKTAGGTVKSLFSETYGRDAMHMAGNYLSNPRRTVETATRTRPDLRLTIGHVPYGLYRPHLPPETRYITFLREPVERVISHFYRHIDGKIELAEALEGGMPDVTNLLTRFLCGHPEILGALPKTAVADAKENLETFTFVGFQDRFEESIVLMQRKLGMPVAAYGASRHVNDERPSFEDVGPEKLELIRAHNQLDIELYAWAVEHFAPQFEEGAALDTAVSDLREAVSAKTEEREERIVQALEWLRKAAPPGSSQPFKELRAQAEAAGFTSGDIQQARRRMPAKKIKSDNGMLLVIEPEPEGTGDEAA